MDSRMNQFVRISRKNSRYFEYEDGTPFVPVGMNLCFERFSGDDAEILAIYRRWFRRFSENGGNFARIWLGVPFLNLEPEKPGVFSERKLENLRALVALGREYGIRLKFTLDHFRDLRPVRQAEMFPGAACFQNRVYRRENGGFADTVEEFFNGEAARANFVRKLELLSRNFADEPAVMAWELWNEVNCVGPVSLWKPWTEIMLGELHRLFPKQFALQSLGSFSDFYAYDLYDELASLDGNDFLQAHRYLDPGAEIDACRGPMDLLCRSAVAELRRRRPERPAILAETGAVEWCHCRASHLYELDREGTLLHDALFAPFFAGSAGCGQFWHWDHIYVDRHDLWHHFGWFARAIAGIDPAAEDYRPELRENRRLRFHILRGNSHDLVWLRDKADWADELDRGVAPERFAELRVPVEQLTAAPVSRVEFNSPWEDGAEQAAVPENGVITFPPFRRSLVARLCF